MTPSLRCRNKSCRLCSSQGGTFTLTGVVAGASNNKWFIVGEAHKHNESGALTFPDTCALVPGQAVELLHCDGWCDGIVDRSGTDLYFKVEGTPDAYERIPLEALARTGRTVRVVE